MAHPEGFSDMGIALTDEAKALSRRTVATAVVGFCREIAGMRKLYRGLKVVHIGGSYANPDKEPRWGVFPLGTGYAQATRLEIYKTSDTGPQGPSDVDVVMDYPPHMKLDEGFLFQLLGNYAMDIYNATHVLIHPIPRNQGTSPSISVRKLLDRVNGK